MTTGDEFDGLPDCIRTVNKLADELSAAIHRGFPSFELPKTLPEARRLDDAGAVWVTGVCRAAVRLAAEFLIERDLTHFTSFVVVTTPSSVHIGGPTTARTNTSGLFHYFSKGGSDLPGDVLGFPPGLDTTFNVYAVASLEDMHHAGLEAPEAIAQAFEDHHKSPTLAAVMAGPALAYQFRGLPRYVTGRITLKRIPKAQWPAICADRRPRILAVRMACLRAIDWIRRETSSLRESSLPRITVHADKQAATVHVAGTPRLAKLGVGHYRAMVAFSEGKAFTFERRNMVRGRTTSLAGRFPELNPLLTPVVGPDRKSACRYELRPSLKGRIEFEEEPRRMERERNASK